MNTQTVTLDSLSRIDAIGKELSKKEIRQQLSNFWLGEPRKTEANKFARALQESDLDSAKSAYINMTKNIGVMNPLRDALSRLSGRDLQSALYDIRGAMMMDKNQADLFSNGNVNEKPIDTKKRVDSHELPVP